METHALEIKVHRMFRFENGGNLKAFVDILINDVLLIKGIKIIEGSKGIFVAMPQEKAKDSKWYDNVRCMKKEVHEQLAEEVLNHYYADKPSA